MATINIQALSHEQRARLESDAERAQSEREYLADILNNLEQSEPDNFLALCQDSFHSESEIG